MPNRQQMMMMPPPALPLPVSAVNSFSSPAMTRSAYSMSEFTSTTSSLNRTKLFVGNLSTDASLPELIDLFATYGKVNEKLCVVKDENYAFIHFYKEKDAEEACKNLNDSFYKNRYIRVQYSTSQGHIKKPVTHPSLTHSSSSSSTNMTNTAMYRSSSAMCFKENMQLKDYADLVPVWNRQSQPMQMPAFTSYGLSEAQLKTNLLIPASFMQSVSNLNQDCTSSLLAAQALPPAVSQMSRFPAFQATPLLKSSQSMYSFDTAACMSVVGSGRPILKSKNVA